MLHILKNLSYVSYRHKKILFSLCIVVFLYGIYSYMNMSTRYEPSIDTKRGFIICNLKNSPASDIDESITKVIENEIINIDGVDFVTSSSYNGTSIISIETCYSCRKSIEIWDDINNKVNMLHSLALPKDTVIKIQNNIQDLHSLNFAIYGDDYSRDDLQKILQDVKSAIYNNRNTKALNVFGYRNTIINIEYINDKLLEKGLHASEVNKIIQDNSINYYNESVYYGERFVGVSTSKKYSSIEDIKNILIFSPVEKKSIPLSDIADISISEYPIHGNVALFNGSDALIASVSSNNKSNLGIYTKEILESIDKIVKELPAGLFIETFGIRSEAVEQSISITIENALITFICVVLLTVMFLGFLPGCIVGITIPFIIIVTFGIMNLSGIGFDRISLSTFIVSLGVLVDNSIVIVDEYLNCIKSNKNKEESVILTCRNLAIPLLTSSLTTIAIFIPLILTDHIVAQYTSPIAIIISYVLIVSYITSITVTPILCSLLLSERHANRVFIDYIFYKFNSFYYESLLKIINNKNGPKYAIGLTIGLLTFAIYAFSFLPYVFFPSSDIREVHINVAFDDNSFDDDIVDSMKSLSQVLNDKSHFPEVNSIVSYFKTKGHQITNAPINEYSLKSINIIVYINDYKSIADFKRKFMIIADNLFLDLTARLSQVSFSGDPEELIIKIIGPELEKVNEITDDLLNDIIKSKITPNIYVNTSDNTPYWQIKINKLASDLGITRIDINEALSMCSSYKDISKLNINNQEYIISVDNKLENCTVRARNNKIYNLSEFLDFETKGQKSKFNRLNLMPMSFLYLKSNDISQFELLKKIQPILNNNSSKIDKLYSIEPVGLIEAAQNSQNALSSNVPICIIFIFLVLMMQFNSFKNVFIVFASLFVSLIGVSLLLNIFYGSFSFMTMLGIYILFGVLFNNSIVLIDKIETDLYIYDIISDEKYNIIIARAASRRFMPIWISSTTTIMSLFPFLINQDMVFYDLSLVIIGGLLVGIYLITFIIPIIYKVMHPLELNKNSSIHRNFIYSNEKM